MDEKQMPGFLTYREAAIMFSLMDFDDAAAAIKATVDYFLYGTEPDLTGPAAQVFEIQRASIDRGRESYRKKSEAGKKGNAIRWHGNG